MNIVKLNLFFQFIISSDGYFNALLNTDVFRGTVNFSSIVDFVALSTLQIKADTFVCLTL